MSLHSVGQPLEVDEQLLNVLQIQKQQINKMKQQNRILLKVNDKVSKKDEQIQQLNKLIKRYKKGYDQYDLIKATMNQKNKQYQRQIQQNKILFNQMTTIVNQNKQLQNQLFNAQKIKQQYVRDRNITDNRMRAIEQTFRQYQQQCKNKQKQLMQELQKSFRQNKQLNERVEQLHIVKLQNQQLKVKITNLNVINSQMNDKIMCQVNSFENKQQQPSQNINIHNTSSLGNQINAQSQIPSQLPSNQRSNYNYSKQRGKSPKTNKSNSHIYDQDANAEIQRLRKQLISKQVLLHKSNSLNHSLSIEFDKSVKKICQFQKQLSKYRKQNHQLKKTLALFLQNQTYQKMHKKNIQKNCDASQDSQEEDQDYQGGGFSRNSSRR